MIFDLVRDYADVLEAMPEKHPRRRILKLLDEAVRRDVHFIDRHSTTFFQCMWNLCWWYDCPEAANYYVEQEGGWKEPPAWKREGPKLCELLERWDQVKKQRLTALPWLRSLGPPSVSLGTAQQAVFRGHEESVESVAFSPDGRRVVSGSKDATVRIWDATSGAALAVLRGDRNWVNGVACTADGRRIVGGSGGIYKSDTMVRVWDAESGELISALTEQPAFANCVAVSPDGRQIACGCRDSTVRLWNHQINSQQVLKGHEGYVMGVAFSPDGARVVSASWDKTLRVWDASSGAAIAVLSGNDDVQCVAWSADGACIASGLSGGTVRLWDWESGTRRAVLRGHGSTVWCVAWSPDGGRIASGAGDNAVRIWDAARVEQLACLTGHDHTVCSVAFSPDGSRIVSGSTDMTVRMWDAHSGREQIHLRGHQRRVAEVAYAPDGRRIGTASDDRTVRIWDAGTGKEIHRLEHELSAKILFSRDGGRIISRSWEQGGSGVLWRFWDVESGAELACLRLDHHDLVGKLSPNGWNIANQSRDGKVRIWDARTGSEQALLSQGERCLSFSPDSRRFATGLDCVIRVYDAASGSELVRLEGHGGETWATFSADARRIVSGSRDRTVRVWDAETGEQLCRFEMKDTPAHSLAFSPDARRIVSAGDRTARVWDAQTGEQLRLLEGHTGVISSAEFTSDGKRIITSAWDKSVRVWDVDTGLCLVAIQGNSDAEHALVRTAVTACEAEWKLHAFVRDIETVIEDVHAQRPVAFFPQPLHGIKKSPVGRQWAGDVGNVLYVVQLVGQTV